MERSPQNILADKFLSKMTLKSTVISRVYCLKNYLRIHQADPELGFNFTLSEIVNTFSNNITIYLGLFFWTVECKKSASSIPSNIILARFRGPK
uniref:Tr-type G domain-containing protein n=1 Tax=Mesocestoides corti TaxID=53468 RepID=A0A5K3EQV2_MESCO